MQQTRQGRFRSFGASSLRLTLLAACLLVTFVRDASSAHAPRVVGFQPRVFAIVHATVVPRPGQVLQDAALVIRDGLIVDVGQDLTIPAGAPVIDAKGLYVYAGFIDAGASDLLDDEREPKPAAGRTVDFKRYILAATRPDNRSGLTPEFQAADGLQTGSDHFDSLRKYGFTAVHVLPAGRIASGTGILLETSAAPLRETLLRDKTFAEFQLFARRGDVYPKTLMGATAHLRQALLDAGRYRLHHDLYAAQAPEVPRPPVDAALAALNEVLQGRQRALFLADTRDDIHRALDLAAEFDLQPTIWGGGEAWRCAQRLKKERAAIIVQLDFGSKPKVDAPQATDELTAEVKQPLRVQEDELAKWKKQAAGLSMLRSEGIPFALSSRNLKNRGELLARLRTAIQAGLPRDDALAALTADAAEILGIGDRLGTLSPGKLAHVVVLSGPFDHEQAKVRYVFIGGQQSEYNEKAKPVEPDKDKQKKTAEPVQPGTPEDDESDAPSVAGNPVRAPIPGANGQPQVAKQNVRPTELEADRLRRPIPTGGNVLIRNATVLTGQSQTLPGTSILVKDGKIAAIGPDLQPEPGMRVIDASGWFVMPGIIDTHSHIMIDGGVNESSQSVVPEVRIKDVVETDDVSEYRALAGGVTAARLLHGSANVIGGQDAVVKLRYGGTAAEHILHNAPQGVKFALGENVKFRTTRFPNTRLGVEATLNRAFMEAIDYRRVWSEYERRKKADPDGAKLLPPRRDLRLEALADIVNHQKFIHSHCYRSDEILMLLRVASDLGIRVWSLQHVLEGYKVALEIVAHGASCSTFADWWAYKVEAFDATPYNAALLREAGANVVIKSDNAELMRHLYLEAAKTVRYGNMRPDHALQAITRNAARELGLEDRIGTIAVGKDADLAIFNGHPLNAFSRCEMTLIEGEVYFSREHAPTAMSESAESASARPAPLELPPDEVRMRQLDLAISPSGRYAIVGATLHPVDGEDVPVGTLLIEAGKITALGPDVKPSEDMTIIDGRGLHVSPGLIDAGSTLGLVEIGKVKETQDYAEGGKFQPDLRAGVALNPDSELLPVARAGGITTVLIRPTGGVIAGQASLAKLAGWTAPDMVLEYEQGLQIIWKDDKEDIAELKQMFDDARLYVKLRAAAREAKQPPPIADPRYDALEPYLNGEKPVYIEANSRQAIAEALLFAEEEELQLVITGGTQAWLLADELKRRGVPVIVGPVMQRPVDSFDPFDSPYANPGRLHEAGVAFCIRSDSASNSRNAPFEAAMAVAYGLPPRAGLRAVTLSAAEILGIDDRVGSLTPGKVANLVISDGSLLQHTTQIKGVFIGGKPFPPESRQTRFYERYRRRLHEYQQEQGQTATRQKP